MLPTSTSQWSQEIEGIQVLFGAGRLADLGQLVSDLGGHRVLLVADPGLTSVGHCDRTRNALESAGLDVALFDQVGQNPSTRDVDAGVEAARGHRADFIVGLGGGSAMDCAKAINILYTNGGRMADYQGFGRTKEPLLPSVGIPTTAGTGSEAQSYALITEHSTGAKMACGDKRALFRAVILDPALTDSLPAATAAASSIDAVSHALESFVTTRRTESSSRYALEAWRRLDRCFEAALRAPGDHTLWGEMLIAAHLAGAAIEASMLGAAHACANPLTASYETTHGVAVALMLPHVMRYNASHVEALYARLLESTHSGERAADLLARRVEDLRHAAGLPARLRDVGIPHPALPQLAEEASRQWTLAFNPRPALRNDLVRLYEAAY